MKRWAALMVFSLAACDKPAAQEGWSIREIKPGEEVGRFQIVAAGSPEKIAGNGIQAFAWRLDTINGDVKFCHYVTSPLIEGAPQTTLICGPQ